MEATCCFFACLSASRQTGRCLSPIGIESDPKNTVGHQAADSTGARQQSERIRRKAMSNSTQSAGLATEDCGLSTIAAQVSTDSWGTLSESMGVFFKSLKLGRVRGIVGIVGSASSDGQDGAGQTQLIQELVSRDILVTLFGYEAGGLNRAKSDFSQHADEGLAELCDFIGITPVLYMDGAETEAAPHDFLNKLAQLAGVDASDLPTATIVPGRSRDTRGLGERFTQEDDPAATADRVDLHIHDKRIGVQWCDRCGGRFSPFS
ncbi:hypothetical protein [Pseudodesulfovibrio cashew]|nr:hypothetical protein [Pseudodesulfovibrio cashew]